MGLQNGGLLTASYGFGAVVGGSANVAGAPPAEVSVAADLTLALAGTSWNAAASNSQGAWDFGSGVQTPALKYADYDGPGGTAFDCAQFQFPAACGTLLPGQLGLVITPSGFSNVEQGSQVDLSVTPDGRVPIVSWRWRQLQGPDVTLSGAASSNASFTAPAGETSLVFEVTATDSAGNEYSRRITLFSAPAVDRDQNGLIEIDNLAMLHNMRHDLTGTSYKTSEGSAGSSLGCPDMRCIGYELTGDLDFDADGDGSSWSEDGDGGYLLDTGDSRAPHFVVDRRRHRRLAADRQLVDNRLHRRLRRQRLQPSATSASAAIKATSGSLAAIGSTAVVRNLGLVDNLADLPFPATAAPSSPSAVWWVCSPTVRSSPATPPARSSVGSGPSERHRRLWSGISSPVRSRPATPRDLSPSAADPTSATPAAWSARQIDGFDHGQLRHRPCPKQKAA